MVKEKLLCPSDKIKDVLKLTQHIYSEFPMDTRDGIKVTLPDGWFLVRGSNTEPIVRVVAESTDEEKARAMVRTVLGQVRECIDS
jgi:phosphomannomutase